MKFGSIHDHVAFQLHLTWRATRKALRAQLDKGERKVSRGSYSIPILIGLNPGITPMQLANALHLDASKVALFLRDLVKQGLVTRTRSTEDRREVQLHLTPAGEAFAQEADLAGAELEAPFDNVLTAQERRTLVALLIKLRDGLS